ncbi:hypothetical protein Tco_0502141 [Tanacetum coccineum]
MNTTQAQQKALDDALVAPSDRLEFGKCNMRLKIDIKPKEATFQVMLDDLALTPFYQVFLINTEVPAIYIQELWAIATVHKSSIRFTINKKKFSLDVEIMGTLETFTTSLTHEKTQVYSAILPQHLTNQAMLESIAYQTYYAYATGEKASKEKYIQKKAESDTSAKKKTAPASKGSRLKSSAKVAKTDKKKQHVTMPKTKGLAVLSEVALTEAEQIKLATKKSKKDFHMSHASGLGDEVDIQSKVPDEQQQKEIGTNEGAGVGLEIPDVPKYNSESEEESWTFSQDDEDDVEESDLKDVKDDQDEEEEKADDEEVSSDQRVSTLPDYELTDEEENKEGDDKEGEQEQDEEDDLYRDVNINLERSDAEMTDAQANKDMEDAYVTLTDEPLVVQQQSSSVSSDLVSMFINHSLDTGIETPSSDTTIPQQPIPNTLPLQQTTDSITTTTTIPTMTLPDIPNFASLFRFEQRVSALETEMSEFKQTNQFAKVVSSIQGIVDNYLASKIKETVDSTMKSIIKEQVQAQVSKIMPKIEKYVTESLEAEVSVRSTNQPQTTYAVAASLSEFELKKILIDKMETNKSIDRSDVQKDLYKALVKLYNSDKDIISSYGDVVTLKRGRDDQDKDEDPSAGSNQGSKRRRSSKDVESSKEPTHKESKSTSSLIGATRSQPKSSGKSAHAEEHGQKFNDLEDQPH